MSSGFSRMVINTRERGVSDDINRTQSLPAGDIAELYRQELDGLFDDGDGLQPPVFSPTAGTAIPLAAKIIQGFMVRPQIGSVSTLIDPGAMFCIDPDSPSSEDENPYKYVRDPGVTDTTLLQMTPNASGSTRFDVIECARVDSTLSSESRDIFDATTGLFTSSSVPKVKASRLQYRIRLGTAGGGVPAMQQGWLPLAVAAVATGSTNWNGATQIYDVRPMVADLWKSPYQMLSRFPQRRARFTMGASLGGQVLYGGSEFSAQYKQWRAGGTVHSDLAVVNMTEAGFTPVANRPFYIYALYPSASLLPRWVQYTLPGEGIRIPQSTKGILVISMTAPFADSGAPSASIAFPTALGLGSTVEGVAVAAGMITSGGTLPDELICDGVVTSQAQQSGTISASTVTSNSATFTLTAGTHIPVGVKAIHASVGAFILKGGSPVFGVTTPIMSTLILSNNMNFIQGAPFTFIPASYPTNFLINSGNIRIPMTKVGTDRSVQLLLDLPSIGCSFDTGTGNPGLNIAGFEF